MKYSDKDLVAIREEIMKDGDNYSFDQRLDQFVKEYGFDDEPSINAYALSAKVRKYIEFQFDQWLAYQENFMAYCAGACTAEAFSDPENMLTGFASWLEGCADNFDEFDFDGITDEDED